MPMRAYGQAKSTASPQSQSSTQAAPSSQSSDCNCDQSETFGPVTFGSDSTNLDTKVINRQVHDALENAKREIEEAMKSEDWQKLSSLPNLKDLQAELRDTVPEALQEAERKVIQIAPFDGDEESGWLGIEIADITSDQAQQDKLPEARGVVVMNVDPDGPAAKAGLKEKDVILSYSDEKVEGVVQFRRLVRETPPGRQIHLTISRDGSTQTITVSVASRQQQFSKEEGPVWNGAMPSMPPMPNVRSFSELPDNDENFFFVSPRAMEFSTPMLGISAEDLSGQLGAYFGTPNGEGVLIREVKSGSVAEKAGLHAGDVIVKLDDKAVSNLRELRADLREKSDQKTVQLGVLRKGSSLNVTVPVEKPRPMEVPSPVHRAQL
jgi:serine protease Do